MGHRLVLSVCLFALVLVAAPSAGAQTLYGGEGTGGLWEFTSAQGGVCPQPNPVRTLCTLGTTCPGVTPPQQTAGSILGDVATDKIRDTVFVTDGRTIHEYTGDTPCNVPAPCSVLNSVQAPTFMGPLTGMGMDSAGGNFTPLGTPLLWITDGSLITGLIPSPPFSCAPYAIAVGPFGHGIAGAIMTDVSWDPVTGTLWCPDVAGFVHNVLVGGGLGAGGSTNVVGGSCGLLGAPLTGLSLDTATPCTITGTIQAYYVTDGVVVDYLDVTGGAAATTFYTPVNCTPTNSFVNGLAHTGHGINYGTPRLQSRIGSFGQSSSPGPSFGLELRNAPLGAQIWLVVNTNFPGPGYACPPIFGLGTNFWVNTVGWSNFYFGTVTASCMSWATPIPASVPACLEIYTQFVLMPASGFIALDATEGLEFTIQRP